jgi:hypothetical protein
MIITRFGVVTDEEPIAGLSFAVYRRVSTVIFVPAESGCAVEIVSIDPLELQAVQDQDAATLSTPPNGAEAGGAQ